MKPIKLLLKNYFLILLYLLIVAFHLAMKGPDKKFYDEAVTYSVIIAVPLVVLFLIKKSPVHLFGLSLDKLSVKLFLSILPLILLNNVFLFVFEKSLGERFTLRPFSLLILLKYLLNTGHIRTFGEELVFRGFLLSRDIKKDLRIFWAANIFQAAVFAFLHALIPVSVFHRLVLSLYIFSLSLVFGVLNRKFDSLFPSWIIHSTSGIFSLILKGS